MSTDLRNVNPNLRNRPPSQPGTLGEQLLAIVMSLQLAAANGTKASDEWDTARTEAANHWSSKK